MYGRIISTKKCDLLRGKLALMTGISFDTLLPGNRLMPIVSNRHELVGDFRWGQYETIFVSERLKNAFDVAGIVGAFFFQAQMESFQDLESFYNHSKLAAVSLVNREPFQMESGHWIMVVWRHSNLVKDSLRAIKCARCGAFDVPLLTETIVCEIMENFDIVMPSFGVPRLIVNERLKSLIEREKLQNISCHNEVLFEKGKNT